MNGVKFSFKAEGWDVFSSGRSNEQGYLRIAEDKARKPESGILPLSLFMLIRTVAGLPRRRRKFYVQAVSAGQKDLNPADYVLKDPKGEAQAIETGAFAIKGDGTHEAQLPKRRAFS